MGQISGFTSKLVDAFVEVLEPVFGRFLSKNRIVAVETETGLTLHTVRRGRVDVIGEIDDARAAKRLRRAKGGAVELRLRPGRILTRTLNLPAAGREYLEPIIEHRLERLTPWRPDKVLFGYAAEGEAAPDGTMSVAFEATSADVAAPSVARLEALDLAPTALGSASEPLERPLRIDLYRGQRDVARKRLRRGVLGMVVVLFALAVPAAAASVWLGMTADARLAELEKRLVTKRAVLRAASGTGEAEGRDRDLIAAKGRETSVTVLIDRLSSEIPDDTYLSELSVEGEKVRLVGFSGNAPALIGLLDADPGLSGVRFAAPVTRTEDGRDSFDIVATWDPRMPGAATTASAGTAPDAGVTP